MGKCANCGVNAGWLMSLCADCTENAQKRASDEATRRRQIESRNKQAEAQFEAEAAQVVLTTSTVLDGFRIVDTVEIVSAECVFGINLFRDLLMGVVDIFGGRSKTAQNALRDARRQCLQELKREAANVGANAVIAVDLDYSEISGKGTSMLFLVATGTAVKVVRV